MPTPKPPQLKSIINNSYSNISNYKVACIVKMKDGKIFKGVNVENPSFKDGMCAEQVAIGTAISEGYKKGDFETIYIMVGTNNISDLKYLDEYVITEFFEPEKTVVIYTLDEESRVLKVGNLYNNIYYCSIIFYITNNFN